MDQLKRAGTTSNGAIIHRTAPNQNSAISHFVTANLPSMNVACRDRSLRYEQWIGQTAQSLASLETADGNSNSAQSIDALRDLSLILASAERHAQANGHAPGWVVSRLPGVEEALLAAAGSERVPVLTGELYWETNDGIPPLSFTAEPHELFFISAVRTQLALRAVVNTQVRNLLDGSWNPRSAEGGHLLRAAATAMREAHEQYLEFRRGPDDHPLMTPAQFNEMRVWLAPTVVGGQTFAGANAAYLAEMVVTDFLLGTADGEYGRYAASFADYQSPAGRSQVAADSTRTPLVLLLANALGFTSEEYDHASVLDVADRIRLAPRALVRSLEASKELISAFVGSSGAHIGLIHVYLEKYESSLDHESLEAMPVKPSHGTGGHSHDHTRHLHDMRRTSPRIRKLLQALNTPR